MIKRWYVRHEKEGYMVFASSRKDAVSKAESLWEHGHLIEDADVMASVKPANMWYSER